MLLVHPPRKQLVQHLPVLHTPPQLSRPCHLSLSRHSLHSLLMKTSLRALMHRPESKATLPLWLPTFWLQFIHHRHHSRPQAANLSTGSMNLPTASANLTAEAANTRFMTATIFRMKCRSKRSSITQSRSFTDGKRIVLPSWTRKDTSTPPMRARRVNLKVTRNRLTYVLCLVQRESALLATHCFERPFDSNEIKKNTFLSSRVYY